MSKHVTRYSSTYTELSQAIQTQSLGIHKYEAFPRILITNFLAIHVLWHKWRSATAIQFN